MRGILCGLVLILFAGGAAHAAPEKTDPAITMAKLEADLMKGANEAQKDQFAKIRAAYGTLRAVADVQSSLDRAVKSCVKENGDMARDLKKAFAGWKAQVGPVLRQGKNQFDLMLATQKVGRANRVHDYLNAFDQTVKAQGDAAHEVPIQKESDCRAMQENMDQSAKTMAGLIKETLGLQMETTTNPAPPPSSTPTE